MFAQTINNTGLFDGATSGAGFLFYVLPICGILHPVHDHRLRRLRAPVRGDQERGRRRGQGHLAVDLLLGDRRLDPAAGLPVRGAGPGRRCRPTAAASCTIFTQALSSGWAGIVLLISTAGQFFCAMACMTSSLPDAVRVQPGRRRARLASCWSKLSKQRVPVNGVILSAVVAALITLPALVTVRPINGATPTPVAFFAVVSIGVVGLYLAFAIPIFLRWRQGDAFKVGSWNLGQQVQVDGAAGAGRDRHHLDRRAVPDLARRACRGTPSSRGST